MNSRSNILRLIPLLCFLSMSIISFTFFTLHLPSAKIGDNNTIFKHSKRDTTALQSQYGNRTSHAILELSKRDQTALQLQYGNRMNHAIVTLPVTKSHYQNGTSHAILKLSTRDTDALPSQYGNWAKHAILENQIFTPLVSRSEYKTAQLEIENSDLSSAADGVTVSIRSNELFLSRGNYEIQLSLSAESGMCKETITAIIPVSVYLHRRDRIHYRDVNNFGENVEIDADVIELQYIVRCKASRKHINYQIEAILWVRVCALKNAIGWRIGRMNLAEEFDKCQFTFSITSTITPLQQIDSKASSLWGVRTPQRAFNRCSLQALDLQHCFGPSQALHSPILAELVFSNASHQTECVSFTSSQTWRSVGLKMISVPPGHETNPGRFYLRTRYQEFPKFEDPFAILNRTGIETNPFIILRVAASYREMRNGAETVTHAFNSISASLSSYATRYHITPFLFAGLVDSNMRIKGGKVLRIMKFRHEEEVLACVRLAQQMKFEYILIDAGWYGNEYVWDSNPMQNIHLDYARKITQIAQQHDLGVFLYINRRHLEQHMPIIATVLRGLGVAGIKFGFVNYTRPTDVEAVVEWGYACYKAGLLVNVHDDFIPGGLHRMLPNIISFEAVLGNEGFPGFNHTVHVSLIRSLEGTQDFTPVVHSPRQELSKVHIMGLPILIFNPLQHLFFYSSSSQIASSPLFSTFWTDLPTSWRRTTWLSGHPDKQAAVLRESPGGRSWYFCLLCGKGLCSVDLKHALSDFVGCNRMIIVQFYKDAGGSSVERSQSRVDDVCKTNAIIENTQVAEGRAMLMQMSME